MDLYNDEDLGLDDVEYFKEFLKFKKNRALLKAKEAELAMEVEKKAVGAIETGTNPPPPGTSPELSINPSPPPYVPLPVTPKVEENGSKLPPQQNAASQPQMYEPSTGAAAAEDLPPASVPVGDDVRKDESGRGRDTERGRDRDKEKTDHSRNRDYESRPRPRYRSRSRERDQWRQQRRSRSRSRSPRDRRDRFEPRPRYDARYQPRRRSRENSPRRPLSNYSPLPAERQVTQNFAYGAPPMMDPMHPAVAAPPMPTEWNAMAAPVQHWEHGVVDVQVPYQEQARKLAIEKEQQQQKETFISQRKEYLKKRENLIVELGLLKAQRRELSSKSKLPEVQKIISGNLKLQEEITTKVKSTDNVLDMLKGLIGDDGPEMKPMTPPSPDRQSDKEKKKSKKRKRSRSGSEGSAVKEPERRSRSRKRDDASTSDRDADKSTKNREKDMPRRGREERFNLVFYDPEVHWCRPCKAFPSTAKEYLLHLHSTEHKDNTQDRKLNDLPWHELSEHKEPVVVKGLETKRCPIKGLQFFEASTAWFCKLCRSWMGDLHCASLHLKSEDHNNKYEDFSMNNPKWEATWLSDRGKAVVSSGKKEDILKRQLEEQLLLQRKHEEELKLTLEATAGLVMPLTLLNKPAPKLKDKDKSKKKSKDKKKGKKKKRSQSSGSSGSSSSSSGSSSSSENDKTSKKKKSKKKKSLKAAVPEKSKWEKDDSEDENHRGKRGTPSGPPPPPREGSHGSHGSQTAMEARRARNYRWADNLSRPTRPVSPPHVPEKHTILIPESSKVYNTARQQQQQQQSSPASQLQVPSLRMRNRDRDGGDDGESRFDKQAQASAKKKQPPSSAPAPKTKFGFIGRMPFTKRKSEPSEEKSRKEQDVATPDPTPPPPPVISKKVVVVEPPPPVLTNKTRVVVAKEILTKSHNTLPRSRVEDLRPVDPVLMEVDMEIDKEPSPPHIQLPPSPPRIRPVLPPEVTTNLGKKMMAVPLPKDFQDALSIIYPEPAPKASTPPPPPLPPPPPSVSMPSPPPVRMSTPSPPPLPEMPQAPSPPNDFESMHKMADYDDFDEMALLGIDKEDMAALRF